MKFRIPLEKMRIQPTQVIRKIGYFRIFDSITKHESFIRKLTTERYPRFHLYLKEESGSLVFDLHLDQRATRYQGQTAHNADYESDQVKQELTRIYTLVREYLT